MAAATETLEEVLASLAARGGPKLRWIYTRGEGVFRIHTVDGWEVVEYWDDGMEVWDYLGLLRDMPRSQAAQEEYVGPRLGERAFKRWSEE